ncbi:FhaA domain-containing protein [Glutamicibacter halophytocola]|uniref:FhaA domain-containing protein n=1 Tax=Glutamicibacter halophytocola TaxID=1933880 RepID=UPI00321B442C
MKWTAGFCQSAKGADLAPNDFVVSLSTKDFETAKSWGRAVVNEMAKVTAEHATSQDYSVQGDVMIHFVSKQDFKPGEMEINSSVKETSSHVVASAPVKTPMAKPVEQASPRTVARTTPQREANQRNPQSANPEAGHPRGRGTAFRTESPLGCFGPFGEHRYPGR